MKTKMLFIALTMFISASFLTSCEKVKGKGEVVTETRSTGTYNSIGLAMSATIYFTPGAEYSLQIRGQENILKQVETQVEGNQLIVRVKSGVILGTHEPITVYITAPDVSGLDVSGSGDINTSGLWNAESVTVNISGSGNINMETLDAANFSANISGSGNIKGSGGAVTREDLRISGSGTIDLRGIVSQTVYTTTSGSGDTYVNAATLLDVTISGSGNIWYYGTPAINTHISGSGNLHRL